MYFDDSIIETVDHHIVVWVGDLTSDELDAFLDEPGGCAANQPHSEFMRDIGKWCDHDFLWAESIPSPGSINDLITACGIDDESLIQQLQSRAIGLGAVQSLVALWNAKLSESTARPRDIHAGRLKCLGSWRQESPLTDRY